MSSIDPSFLLQLPGELRNRIYQFVLTEPNKIIPHTGDSSNQLRLVCRQLHEETNWLELSCNNPITFIRDDALQRGPAEQFLAFTKAVAPNALSWLKTIILIDRAPDLRDYKSDPDAIEYLWSKLNGPEEPLPFVPETASVLVELSNLCRAYPQVEVRYMLPGFYLDKTRPWTVVHFMMRSIFYSFALYTTVRDDLVPKTSAQPVVLGSMLSPARDWLQVPVHRSEKELEDLEMEAQRTLASYGPLSARLTESLLTRMRKDFHHKIWSEASVRLRTPNLKFCASQIDMEEGVFRQMLNEAARHSAIGSELVNAVIDQGLLDKWESEARKWMKDGI